MVQPATSAATTLLQQLPANASVRPLLDSFQVFQADLFHGLNQRLPASRFPADGLHIPRSLRSDLEYSTAEFRARFAEQARHAAARADLIICVSQFTANQVRDLFGVDSGRLRVIAHGARFRRGAKMSGGSR